MKTTEHIKSDKLINERAYETAFELEITQEQLQKLIQDKFERARMYQEAAKKLANS